MDIKKIKENDSTIYVLDGRMDTQNSPDIQLKFEEGLNLGEKKIILDMAKVQYLSSAGLRVILWLQKKLVALDNDNALVLINVDDEIYEILEMTGFTDFLVINP